MAELASAVGTSEAQRASQPAGEPAATSSKPEKKLWKVEMPTDVPAQSGWCRCVEDCYTIVKQIGEGTYGQVYLAKETQTQAMVALKKIRMDTEKEGFPITAMREMRLLTRLQHQNVLSLKEVVRSRREVTASTPHNLLAGRETLKLSLYLLCLVQLTVGMIQVIQWITCLCTCPFQSAELDRILACTVWAPVVMLNTHLHAAKKSNQERGSIYMVFEYMDHDLTGLMERRNYKFQASHVCAMPLHAPARPARLCLAQIVLLHSTSSLLNALTTCQPQQLILAI